MPRTKGSKNKAVSPPVERITGDISPDVAIRFKTACTRLRKSHGAVLEPLITDWLKTEAVFGEEYQEGSENG